MTTPTQPRATPALYRVSWSWDGSIIPDQCGQGEPCEMLSAVQAEAQRLAHRPGRSPRCVTILRDGRGEDHPSNAGKFFLHAIVK